ncbi:ParA family protein [Candidatus Thorarchaeota archaeon]|nr:MAG: ParA family protein [Candidatus Thorarchaeota archaeon]
MKTLTLHSYKGGTGRTTLAANIAAILAQRGNKVAVLDLDSWSPSLHTIFRIEPNSGFMHQYLSGSIDHRELITDLTPALNLEGELHVGVADYHIDVIRENLSKDRKWHMNALSRLLHLKEELRDEKFDYVVMDSSPGIHSSTVNAVVASDLTLVICKIDNFDLDGTVQLMDVLYERLDKETAFLFNKVPPPMLEEPRRSQVEDIIENAFGSDAVLMGFMEYYPEIPLSMGIEVHALTSPDLKFTRNLKDIVSRLSIVSGYAESASGEC